MKDAHSPLNKPKDFGEWDFSGMNSTDIEHWKLRDIACLYPLEFGQHPSWSSPPSSVTYNFIRGKGGQTVLVKSC